MTFPTTAKELGRFLGAEILGDLDRKIEILSSIDSPQEKSLVFLSDKKFASLIEKTSGVTLLTRRELVPSKMENTFLVVEDPRLSFAKVANNFMPKNPWSGISPLAQIHPTAQIAEGVSVGPFAVIGEDAVIGRGTTIYPQAYIGPGVKVGENTEIFPHVVLVSNTTIGNRVKIFAGTVIGSEGFGFFESGAERVAMPQIGQVFIEDDVRIGAKCTIDRSTLGETRIGKGSKLDDQVHVGHNCIIGKNCILCGQATLGGSTILEDGVILGGQVGLSGHLTVGKGAAVAGRSGANSSLKPGERYFGSPALPLKEALRIHRATTKLPEILERLKKLENQLLEGQHD